MNLDIANLKSVAGNEQMSDESRADALRQLRAIALRNHDPRSLDAQFVLKELESTDKPSVNRTSDDYQARIDAELERWINKAEPDPEDNMPTLPEAERAVSDFLAIRVGPYREAEPLILERLKHLFKSSGSATVKQRAFRSIVYIATRDRSSRACQPAQSWLKNFTPEQQVEACGGVSKVPDILLLSLVQDKPTDANDPLIREAARRAQLFPRSILRKTLPDDYLKVEFLEGLGTEPVMESAVDFDARFTTNISWA